MASVSHSIVPSFIPARELNEVVSERYPFGTCISVDPTFIYRHNSRNIAPLAGLTQPATSYPDPFCMSRCPGRVCLQPWAEKGREACGALGNLSTLDTALLGAFTTPFHIPAAAAAMECNAKHRPGVEINARPAHCVTTILDTALQERQRGKEAWRQPGTGP